MKKLVWFVDDLKRGCVVTIFIYRCGELRSNDFSSLEQRSS